MCIISNGTVVVYKMFVIKLKTCSVNQILTKKSIVYCRFFYNKIVDFLNGGDLATVHSNTRIHSSSQYCRQERWCSKVLAITDDRRGTFPSTRVHIL